MGVWWHALAFVTHERSKMSHKPGRNVTQAGPKCHTRAKMSHSHVIIHIIDPYRSLIICRNVEQPEVWTKFSSITLPLIQIEFRRSYYDVYSSWISWIYRDNAYCIQLNFCKIVMNKNSHDRNILVQQKLPIRIQCLNQFLTQTISQADVSPPLSF